MPRFAVVVRINHARARRLVRDAPVVKDAAVRQPDGRDQPSAAQCDAVTGTGCAHIPFHGEFAVRSRDFHRLRPRLSVIRADAMENTRVILVENQVDQRTVGNQRGVVRAVVVRPAERGGHEHGRLRPLVRVARAAADHRINLRPVVVCGHAPFVADQHRPALRDDNAGDAVFRISPRTERFERLLPYQRGDASHNCFLLT